MLIIVNRFRHAKRKECELNRTTGGESPGELRAEDTDTWAWAENFHFLQDTIGRLECRNTQHRTKFSDLSAENSGLSPDVPTKLGQEILLRFFGADTTELCEAAILEMYPDNRFAARVALAELCDHNLLAVTQLVHAGKLYIVTTKGQSLCFYCRN